MTSQDPCSHIIVTGLKMIKMIFVYICYQSNFCLFVSWKIINRS